MSEKEDRAREKIVNQAKWFLSSWGGVWDPAVDKVGPEKYKIAGKLCADEATRERQGGILMSTIFMIAGHPSAAKCRTISREAVAMYTRKGGYTAAERNNTDIPSWCGIFALFVYKMAGLTKLPSWDNLKVFGVSAENKKLLTKDRCWLETTQTPKRGDIGVIGAREVKDSAGNVIIKMGQNHHFIITDVNGGSVSSIDGNAGKNMEIISNRYQISNVVKSGGFYTPIWDACM